MSEELIEELNSKLRQNGFKTVNDNFPPIDIFLEVLNSYERRGKVLELARKVQTKELNDSAHSKDKSPSKNSNISSPKSENTISIQYTTDEVETEPSIISKKHEAHIFSMNEDSQSSSQDQSNQLENKYHSTSFHQEGDTIQENEVPQSFETNIELHESDTTPKDIQNYNQNKVIGSNTSHQEKSYSSEANEEIEHDEIIEEHNSNTIDTSIQETNFPEEKIHENNISNQEQSEYDTLGEEPPSFIVAFDEDRRSIEHELDLYRKEIKKLKSVVRKLAKRNSRDDDIISQENTVLKMQLKVSKDREMIYRKKYNAVKTKFLEDSQNTSQSTIKNTNQSKKLNHPTISTRNSNNSGLQTQSSASNDVDSKKNLDLAQRRLLHKQSISESLSDDSSSVSSDTNTSFVSGVEIFLPKRSPNTKIETNSQPSVVSDFHLDHSYSENSSQTDSVQIKSVQERNISYPQQINSQKRSFNQSNEINLTNEDIFSKGNTTQSSFIDQEEIIDSQSDTNIEESYNITKQEYEDLQHLKEALKLLKSTDAEELTHKIRRLIRATQALPKLQKFVVDICESMTDGKQILGEEHKRIGPKEAVDQLNAWIFLLQKYKIREGNKSEN